MSDVVNAPDVAPATKATYLMHADRFVRWRAGEVEVAPGETARQ